MEYIFQQSVKKIYENFLKKRLLPVWLSFAWLYVYLLLKTLFSCKVWVETEYSGIHRMGSNCNSMGLLFSHLLCTCVLSHLSGLFKTKNDTIKLICFTVLCMGGVIVSILQKEPNWWNTLNGFPLGSGLQSKEMLNNSFFHQIETTV